MVVKCFKGGFSQKGLPGQGQLPLGKKPTLPGHGSAECFPRLFIFSPEGDRGVWERQRLSASISSHCAGTDAIFADFFFPAPQDNLIIAFQPGSLRKPRFPGQSGAAGVWWRGAHEAGSDGSGTRRRSRRKLGFSA